LGENERGLLEDKEKGRLGEGKTGTREDWDKGDVDLN